MANEQLRQACADILQSLGVQRMTYPTLQQGARMQRGAATLRWCERFEYGEPVPADEYAAAIEAAVEEVEQEIQALRKLVAPRKLAKHDAEWVPA